MTRIKVYDADEGKMIASGVKISEVTMSSPPEECYLMNHTLYGVVQREAEDDEEQSGYDPMEAAEARWEFENER